ncbi:MAG: hypothetical protein U1E42_06565 [Rhodospirillales bacterium]
MTRPYASEEPPPLPMQRLAQTLSLIAAVVGGVAAVVILSRVLLTLDDLESGDLRLAYGVGILAITALAAFAVWRILRGPRRPQKRPSPAVTRKAPETRLDHLFQKHGLESDPRDAALRTRRRGPGEPVRIALVGVRRSGKSGVAAGLDTLLSAEPRLPPYDIIEIPGLGNDFATNLEAMTPAFAAHIVLFVVDQDLRDYEFAALKALAERGAAPIVVLNKSDQRDAVARAETRQAVVRRLAHLVAADDIVEAAADPLPVVRVARDAGGHDVETEVTRPADVAAIAERVILRLRA